MLPRGRHEVVVGDRSATVVGEGRPASLTVDGLAPGGCHDVVVDGQPAGTARTLDPAPGAELCRVATLSDIHVGDGETFGILPAVRSPLGPPQRRCLEAALAEIRAWGAQLLLVKGDLTHNGHPAEWERVGEVLASAGIPVIATVGNHDHRAGAVDGTPILAAAGIDLAFRRTVHRDLPGLRVIAADVTTGWHHGSYGGVGDAIVDAAATAAAAVLVGQHHQLHRAPFPTHWPPGILGPASGRFIRRLAAANRRSLVTSGHTHRCRARRRSPVLVTEVGSPKDHPGVWAGYVVSDGGIRQVLRRVADPDVLAWTQETARALFGIWGRWSPGRLSDRSFSHTWEQ